MRGMSERKPQLQHYAEYAGWLFCAGLLKLLPRRATVLLARACAFAAYRVFRLRRDTMEENLRIAFGDSKSPKELDRIAIGSMENALLTFFEFVQPEPFFGSVVDLFVELEGMEQTEQMRDGGGIVVTAHIGNWEAGGSCGTSRHGFPMAAVMKPIHNPLVNGAIVRQRHKAGMELISTGANMKAAVSAAQRGKWLTIVGDQDARRHGIFVNFFGKPASTAEGPGLFAWKLNLPIAPLFAVRLPGPRRELKAIGLPLIHPDPSAPRDDEIRRLTEAHVRALEDTIRRYPDSYFWLHRRWKTKPKRGRDAVPAPPVHA